MGTGTFLQGRGSVIIVKLWTLGKRLAYFVANRRLAGNLSVPVYGSSNQTPEGSRIQESAPASQRADVPRERGAGDAA
jgi:hypothetical protein